MRHRDKRELRYPVEIARVTGVKRYASSNRRRRDHRIEGPRGRLPPCRTQCCSDSTEGARGGRVERQRDKVRFYELQARLPRRPLLVGPGDKRPNRKLRESNRTDFRFDGKKIRIRKFTQQDQRRGIK
jgi:hypothetical protein